MKNNNQQSQEFDRNIKSNSCKMEKSGFSPKETGGLTNGSVEDSQPNSSFSPADAKLK